jgi:hypothetical protein
MSNRANLASPAHLVPYIFQFHYIIVFMFSAYIPTRQVFPCTTIYMNASSPGTLLSHCFEIDEDYFIFVITICMLTFFCVFRIYVGSLSINISCYLCIDFFIPTPSSFQYSTSSLFLQSYLFFYFINNSVICTQVECSPNFPPSLYLRNLLRLLSVKYYSSSEDGTLLPTYHEIVPTYIFPS